MASTQPSPELDEPAEDYVEHMDPPPPASKVGDDDADDDVNDNAAATATGSGASKSSKNNAKKKKKAAKKAAKRAEVEGGEAAPGDALMSKDTMPALEGKEPGAVADDSLAAEPDAERSGSTGKQPASTGPQQEVPTQEPLSTGAGAKDDDLKLTSHESIIAPVASPPQTSQEQATQDDTTDAECETAPASAAAQAEPASTSAATAEGVPESVPTAGFEQHEVIPAPVEPLETESRATPASDDPESSDVGATSAQEPTEADPVEELAASIPPATVSVVNDPVPAPEIAPQAQAEATEGGLEAQLEQPPRPRHDASVPLSGRPDDHDSGEASQVNTPQPSHSSPERETHAETAAPVASATQEELFASSDRVDDEATDDLFGTASAPQDTDDFFSGSAAKDAEDDIFGGATDGPERADDLFASDAKASGEDLPWSQSEPAGKEEDDLFKNLAGSSQSAFDVSESEPQQAAAATNDADIFADISSGAGADDFFASAANETGALDEPPARDQSQEPTSESTEADLFGGTTTEEPWLETAGDLASASASAPAPTPVAAADLNGVDLDAMGVPEGWLDDTGGWNWYTEDERIEVAQQMIKDNLATAPVSESDARRTPIPAGSSNIYEPTQAAALAPEPSSPYNPYDPPRPTPSTAAYAPAPAAYTPPIASSSYLPPSSPYNPPSPATSRYAPAPAAVQPYATSTVPRNFQPTPPVPKAPAVYRSTTSTAYDPPILQPSAKLSRPASAAPAFVPPLPNAYAPPAPVTAAPVPPRAPPKPVASSMSRSGTPTAFDPPLPPPRPRPASRSSSFSQHHQQPLVPASVPPVPPLPAVAPAPVALPPPPRGPPRAPSRANLRAEYQPPPPMPSAPPPPPAPAPTQSYDRPRSASPLASMQAPPLARSPPISTQQGSSWAPKHRSQLSRDATPQFQQEPVLDVNDDDAAFDPEAGAFDGVSATSPPRSRPGLSSHTFEPPAQTSNEEAFAHHESAPAANSYEPFAQGSAEPSADANQPPVTPAYEPSTSASYEPQSTSVYSPAPPAAYQQPPPVAKSYDQPPANMAYSPVNEPLAHLAPPVAVPASPARTRSASTYDSPARPNLLPTDHTAAPRSAYEPVQSVNNASIDEDPLGRGSDAIRRVPCASFGPSGQLLLVFPSDEEDRHADLSGAAGYGFSSAGRTVRLRDFASVVPPSAGSSSTLTFPGPLIFDGPAAKAPSADKKKRQLVDQYLADRISEIETGLPYLTVKNDPQARSREEAKLVLMRLLQRLVAADGRPKDDPSEVVTIIASSSSTPAPAVKSDAASRPLVSRSQFTSLLVHAQREEALSHAIENNMWPDALLVASSLGPEAWQRCITAYIAAELTPAEDASAKLVLPAIYSLYGSTPDAFAHMTPQELGQSWRDILAAIIGAKSVDSAADLLGDKLVAIGLVEAGHCCYLVSSLLPTWTAGNTSAIGKYPLLGQNSTDRHEESTIYSELLEYALALRPSKDFAGVLHLLPYKVNKAQHLLASGQRNEAQRYCDSILGTLKASRLNEASAPVLITLVDSLTATLAGKELSNLALKRGAKPNLDKIGSWFEGRLTKFIAGDEGDAPAEKTISGGVEVGPFSHYSTITPEQTQVPSRTPSSYDVYAQPPSRTPSAMAMRAHEAPPQASQPQQSESRPESEYNAPIQLPSWGQSYDFDDGAVPDADVDASELINPMQNLSVSLDRYALKSASMPQEDEEEDDLGFGNASRSAPAPKAEPPAPVETTPEPQPKAEPPKPAKEEDGKPAGGSWLGRWWGKKEEAPTGPVRAKLGEKTSMYYDKELKRWVTPGAPVEAVKAAPPPPKAATPKPAASSAPSPTPTPPKPPAAASGPPSGPPAGPPRPASAASSSDPPLGDALAPPSRKPAKKNIRSRYVDVMK